MVYQCYVHVGSEVLTAVVMNIAVMVRGKSTDVSEEHVGSIFRVEE
jgi:hypothetical protein